MCGFTDFKTGCQLNDKSAWDEGNQLVNDGYKGPKGETALSNNTEPRKERKPRNPDFYATFEKFVKEGGEKNAWTEGTFEKWASLKRDLQAFKSNIKFSDLTEPTLTEFVAYLRDNKTLRTPRKKKGDREKYDHDDITDLKNATIEKKLRYLRWFLNWATERGVQYKPDIQDLQTHLEDDPEEGHLPYQGGNGTYP